MPTRLLESIMQRGTSRTRKTCSSYLRNVPYWRTTMENYPVTDIMCLPTLDSILRGKEILPPTNTSVADCQYYTADEYCSHLENIIHCLITYPLYNVVIMDTSIYDNLTLYAKGDNHAVVIKETESNTIFEVAEYCLATNINEYLRHIVRIKSGLTTREQTIQRLEQEIQQLKSAIH